MTPEFPRAPISDAWPIALQTAGEPEPGGTLVELGHHGLDREGHVGAGVAVGHRIDVQPIDVALMQA